MELEIEFAFSSMIYRSGKVTNHNSHKKFLKLLPLLLENFQHVQSKTNKKNLHVGNFTRRKRLLSFEYGCVYNPIVFRRILTALFKQNAQFILKLLATGIEIERTMGGNHFRDFLPINVPNRYRDKFMFHDDKLSKTTEDYYFETLL